MEVGRVCAGKVCFWAPLSPHSSYLSLSTGLVLEEEPCSPTPAKPVTSPWPVSQSSCFWPPGLTVFTTIGNCPAQPGRGGCCPGPQFLPSPALGLWFNWQWADHSCVALKRQRGLNAGLNLGGGQLSTRQGLALPGPHKLQPPVSWGLGVQVMMWAP